MEPMRTGPAIRRLRAERRVFELHARLAVAREEVAVVAAQHAELQTMADEARLRMLVSETALAHREWEQARRHADTLSAALSAARGLVAQLEAAEDAAFDDLLLPAP